MTKLLGRVWLPVLVVAAVAVGALTVMQLRGVFGSDPILVTSRGSENAESFDPKEVTYEVFGSGTTAVINYLDLDGQPQRAVDVSLPWSLTLSTTVPSVSANIIAQGDGDNIACRVTVDGEVKEEQQADGLNAQTVCVVKSA
jgi:hypothetical protein